MVPDPPVQIIPNGSSSAPAAPSAIVANGSGSSPAAPPVVVSAPSLSTPAVPASGTVTFNLPTVDGNTLVIGAITYTWRTVAASNYDIEIPTAGEGELTFTDFIQALIAAMETPSLYIPAAHPTVRPVGYTSPVLTLEARTAGEAGNTIPLAETGVTMTVSGAFLTDGAEATGPEAPEQVVGNGSGSSPSAPVQIVANGSGSSPSAPPVVIP